MSAAWKAARRRRKAFNDRFGFSPLYVKRRRRQIGCKVDALEFSVFIIALRPADEFGMMHHS